MACLLSYLCSYISPFIMYCLICLLVNKVVCKYDQSLPNMETYIPTKFHVDINYGFLLKLWELNLNKKEEKNKMKNSAHHSPIHL